MPRTLTDADGNTHTLAAIRFGDLERLAAAGLDVEAASEDLALLADLARKPRQLVAAIHALCPTLPKAAIDGDTLHRGLVALRDSVIDFFPMPATERAKLIERLNSGPDGSDAGASNSPASPGSTPDPGAPAT